MPVAKWILKQIEQLSEKLEQEQDETALNILNYLCNRVNELENENQELKEEIKMYEDNYKPVDPYESYGVNKKDF